MNANMLFAKLVQHLTNYNDAAVLWTLLKERADCKEIGISVNELASLQLCDSITRNSAHRTIEKLQQMGFITVRVQHKSKTLVTVNRAAVLDLLNQPLPERLPACSQKTFPFLDAWNAQLEAKAESNEQPSD
ncbi:UNVERIFIED_ORG: hypothetical protein HNP28_003688 [Comamonas terrigena]